MKKGFSLVELVFAIVIFAISLVALPNIVQKSQLSNEFALKQEILLNAKTKVGEIMVYPWDISSCFGDANCGDVSTPIFLVDSNKTRHSSRDQNSNRNGLEYSDARYIAGGGGISDFDGPSEKVTPNITASPTGGSGDFLTVTKLDVDVEYINISIPSNHQNSKIINNITLPNTGSLASESNVKRVKVDAVDDKGEFKATLYSFSFNIGDLLGVSTK
ncbi:MAG: type II secretion system protein [Campylobacter sp.]|nr:type II secretion system protein [Campylobacter sp.]